MDFLFWVIRNDCFGLAVHFGYSSLLFTSPSFHSFLSTPFFLFSPLFLFSFEPNSPFSDITCGYSRTHHRASIGLCGHVTNGVHCARGGRSQIYIT